jgi:hypothetical protein
VIVGVSVSVGVLVGGSGVWVGGTGVTVAVGVVVGVLVPARNANIGESGFWYHWKRITPPAKINTRASAPTINDLGARCCFF